MSIEKETIEVVIPKELKTYLQARATLGNRDLNAEIILRIRQSIEFEFSLQDIIPLVQSALEQVDILAEQAGLEEEK